MAERAVRLPVLMPFLGHEHKNINSTVDELGVRKGKGRIFGWVFFFFNSINLVSWLYMLDIKGLFYRSWVRMVFIHAWEVKIFPLEEELQEKEPLMVLFSS